MMKRIYDNMNVENIEPYMPANRTERDIFKSNWCSKCKKDKIFCPVLGDTYFGEQPAQWIYWDNKPTCTAFEEHQEKEDIEDEGYLESGVIWPHQCRHRNYGRGCGCDYICLDCGYEWDDYSGDKCPISPASI
jgi:hypothetical protein